MPVYKLTKLDVYANEWTFLRCTLKGANIKKKLLRTINVQQYVLVFEHILFIYETQGNKTLREHWNCLPFNSSLTASTPLHNWLLG